jgi:osmoprotectant transport system permease protein
MDFLNDIPKAFAYIGGHPDEFKGDLATHLRLSLFAVLIAFAICFPLGVLASRSRFASLLALNAGGVLRAIPSVAILFVLYPYLGLGFRPTLVALTLLACFPILANTNTGFREVDPATREAAYGMGMTTLQVLGRIELPLASPIVIAGLRTATVDVIATATLATFIGAGGLGDYISRGLALNDTTITLVGVIPVALLTLGAEIVLGMTEFATRRATGQAART